MDMKSILHMMAYSKELRDHSQILCQKHKHVDIVHLIFGSMYLLKTENGSNWLQSGLDKHDCIKYNKKHE